MELGVQRFMGFDGLKLDGLVNASSAISSFSYLFPNFAKVVFALLVTVLGARYLYMSVNGKDLFEYMVEEEGIELYLPEDLGYGPWENLEVVLELTVEEPVVEELPEDEEIQPPRIPLTNIGDRELYNPHSLQDLDPIFIPLPEGVDEDLSNPLFIPLPEGLDEDLSNPLFIPLPEDVDEDLSNPLFIPLPESLDEDLWSPVLIPLPDCDGDLDLTCPGLIPLPEPDTDEADELTSPIATLNLFAVTFIPSTPTPTEVSRHTLNPLATSFTPPTAIRLIGLGIWRPNPNPSVAAEIRRAKPNKPGKRERKRAREAAKERERGTGMVSLPIALDPGPSSRMSLLSSSSPSPRLTMATLLPEAGFSTLRDETNRELLPGRAIARQINAKREVNATGRPRFLNGRRGPLKMSLWCWKGMSSRWKPGVG
ncbi:hypothetical protein DXG03_007282 [Asterophora parasitica]|uniref:Uncharacterized protein n=1 Tax=Asterophora parasitica TaxID=117018 RepID=A0A9P7G926_9AGAR|nr:hypothetical protein DXG03_007282 [Asterophora parasitica]